jgi:hypothetical protein
MYSSCSFMHCYNELVHCKPTLFIHKCFFWSKNLLKSETIFLKEHLVRINLFSVNEIAKLLQILRVVLLFFRWICTFLDEQVNFHPNFIYFSDFHGYNHINSFITLLKITFWVAQNKWWEYTHTIAMAQARWTISYGIGRH